MRPRLDMYAKSISIINFRRFAAFECSFDPRFTLLMGPNGSGKSSLLRAMHVALRSLFSSLNVPMPDLFEESSVRRMESVDPADESWRTPQYPSRIKLWVELDRTERVFAAERLAANNREYVCSDGDRAASLDAMAAARALGPAWFDPAASTASPLIARFGPSGSTEAGVLNGVQKPFSTKQEIWQRFDSDIVNANGLAQWFQYNELRTLQEGKPPLMYRLAKAAVLGAIHAEDIRYVVRDNQLMLLHRDHGWRPYGELSDGQRRLAAIFSELALRCASLNSQLGEDAIAATPGIVTIDELDLHLYPAWQRCVVPDLLRVFPKLQFIATSHSPFLLQAAFESGRVVDMRNGQFVDPGDTSIEDITEGVMGVAQPQRGQRFQALQALAADYLALLESSPSSPEELSRVKHQLDDAMAVFANEPASAAWLAQRREAAGL